MKPKTNSESLKIDLSKNKYSTILILPLLVIAMLLPGISSFAGIFTTTGALNGNGVPFPWTNKNAWKEDGNAAGRAPISSDVVILSHSLDIPQGADVYCKTLTLDNTTTGIELFLRAGATLKVYGDVFIKSPKQTSEINSINLPQGNLNVDGSIYLGQIPSNSYYGKATLSVAGAQTSYGTITVQGNITNSNTYNNPQTCELSVGGYGILEIGGLVGVSTKLSASFNNNSSVKFIGSSPQTLPSSVSYVNLYVSNPSGVYLSEPLNSGNLSGDIVVESGKLVNNGLSISGKNASILQVKNGARLELTGTTTFPDGFGSVSLEPTSTVAYTGSGNQNVAVQTYGNLELTGGAGKQKILVGHITAGNTTVDADLMLDLGGLNIGNNTLTLKSNGSIKNATGTNSKYIILGTTGKMLVENIGPSGRNTEVVFPIGSSTNFTPAYLKNTGTTHNFSVGVIDGVKNYATNQVYSSHVINKTWNISQETSGTGAMVDVRLQWNPSDEAFQFDRTACYVTHYTNNAWSKSDIYQNATLASMSAKMTGVTSFSPFSVADGGNPLPVELVFFKAAKQDNGVALTWETASEKNNKGYDVQVSTDGKHFEFVSFVASKNGNANYSQRYEFLDKTSRSGLVYYRLKQTDFDGTVAYYAAKVVDMGKFTESVSAYPNPFRDQFEIKLQAAAAQDVLLQITDMAGKTVYRNAPKVIAGQNIIPVTLENNLPAGLYILTAKTATHVYTTRIVKQ